MDYIHTCEMPKTSYNLRQRGASSESLIPKIQYTSVQLMFKLVAK